MRHENRYHCGYCYTSYSVTVGTIFHHSHIDLAKWFQAIFLITTLDKDISIRQLAKAISVTNRTASSMIKRIKHANQDNPKMLRKIADFYAEYIGRDKP